MFRLYTQDFHEAFDTILQLDKAGRCFTFRHAVGSGYEVIWAAF